MAGPRAETLDLRITREQKELIRRAAAVRGQNMTEFVLATVEPVARALLERQAVIELSQAAWHAFTRMVEEPGAATPLARREAAAFLAEMSAPADVPG
jgi:uncharacterized protein (DUF1778 family)